MQLQFKAMYNKTVLSFLLICFIYPIHKQEIELSVELHKYDAFLVRRETDGDQQSHFDLLHLFRKAKPSVISCWNPLKL